MGSTDASERKMEARLEEIDAEIAKLKAKAKGAEADAEIEYEKHLSELRERREEVSERLARLKDAGDDAAGDLRTGLEDAWRALGEALDKAKSRFR
jgi:chromosome segregation ATPase